VLGLSPCDQRLDAERAQLATIELVVVAAVCDQALRSPLPPAGSAAHGWDRFEQQEELRAFVAVRAGDSPGKRDAAAVG
jgi:hypothetical protein